MALQRKAEHERINAERALVQKNVDCLEEAACYQKFVVKFLPGRHPRQAPYRAGRSRRQSCCWNDAERKERAEAALQGGRRASRAEAAGCAKHTKAPAVAKVYGQLPARLPMPPVHRMRVPGGKQAMRKSRPSMPTRSQPRPPTKQYETSNSRGRTTPEKQRRQGRPTEIGRSTAARAPQITNRAQATILLLRSLFRESRAWWEAPAPRLPARETAASQSPATGCRARRRHVSRPCRSGTKWLHAVAMRPARPPVHFHE